MTDHHDPLDDLASAHLDAATTPAEAAQVASDADLQARVERLARARDAVRTGSEPIDVDRREAAIAAALAAFDDADAEPAGGARVTPITSARTRRPVRALRLVAAAAVLALLALAVPLLGSLDSGSRDEVATPPTNQSSADAFAGAGGGSAGSRAAEGGATMEVAGDDTTGPGDLGAFEDLPQLTEEVREELSGAAGTLRDAPPAGANDPSRPCGQEPDADGQVIYQAYATLAGRPVLALVREDPDGGRTLIVLDRADCSRVAGGKL